MKLIVRKKKRFKFLLMLPVVLLSSCLGSEFEYYT